MLSSKKSKNVERWEQKNHRKFLKCWKRYGNYKYGFAKIKFKKCPFPTLNTRCYSCPLRRK